MLDMRVKQAMKILIAVVVLTALALVGSRRTLIPDRVPFAARMILTGSEFIIIGLLLGGTRADAATLSVRCTPGARVATDRPFADRCAYLYAALANRLGVWQIKWELEDLSLRFLDPEAYRHIARQLEQRREERLAYISKTIEVLETEFEKAGIRADIWLVEINS